MKTKITVAVIIILGLISLASAQLSISPDRFNINGYPGESFVKQFNISTEGNQAVYINITRPDNILVNSPSPIIVEKSKIIELNFTIAADSIPSDYDILLKVSLDVFEDIRIINNTRPTVYRQGGTKIIYVNRTNNITSPPIVIEQPKEENKIVLEPNNSAVNKTQNKFIEYIKDPKNNLIVYGIAALIVAFLIFLWFRIDRSQSV